MLKRYKLYRLITFLIFSVTITFIPNKEVQAFQTVVTGEIMESPFFNGADYSDWSFTGAWRDDGANDRLAFEVKAINSGFPAAIGAGKDLTSEANITGNSSYTSSSNAYLTGVTFNSPFLDRAAEGNAGTNADYNLFFEFDINTGSGTYRAKSASINNPWEQAAASISPTFTWETGSFLGDPADSDDGGVALSDITSIEYKAVMQVVSANDNGAGTVFVLLDNMSLTYNVELRAPDLSITGSEGWRMLSSPTSDNTYADLLDTLWTQGIGTGADVTNGTANVQFYNTSADDFAAVTDLTTTMTSGSGFITYVYNDQDNDGSDEGFPKTLSLSGTLNSGVVSPTLNTEANAFTLVGNPYGSTIDWDLLTRSDVTGTVYTYDNSVPGYIQWNGTTGDLTDGLLTSYQGFWVQNTSGSPTPSLTIEEADKTTGGTFYKEVNNPIIELKATTEDLEARTFFSFSKTGRIGKDNYDGLRLDPMDHKDFLVVNTLLEDENLSINNLPLEFKEKITIPLSVESFKSVEEGWVNQGTKVTLSWPELNNIPEDWTITLIDYQTGGSIDLLKEESYSFDLTVSKEKTKPKTIYSELSPITVVKSKSNAENTRFGISIEPSTSVSIDDEVNSITEFKLDQNYPNPFNPSTTIKYAVGENGPVNITIYNVMGQKVAELLNTNKTSGNYQITWNASGVASGIYYYRLTAPGQVLTRQMTLIK